MAAQQNSSAGGILFLVVAGAVVAISAANFVGAKLGPVLYPEQHAARLAQQASEAEAERLNQAETARQAQRVTDLAARKKAAEQEATDAAYALLEAQSDSHR